MLKGVYFYLRPYLSPENAGYQHRCVALAEGLQALGVRVFANVRYWRIDHRSEATLFTPDPDIGPEDCDVAVMEHVLFEEEKRLPAAFTTPHRRYRTVLIDAADGWRTPAMQAYSQGIDCVLKCHFSSRFKYGDNVRPWAFGLSQRILTALETASMDYPRTRNILCNYRTLHPVRKRANERFLPLLSRDFEIDHGMDENIPSDAYDMLMWRQTGKRHHPDFYAKLKRSSACSAFGGYYVADFSRSLESLPLRAATKLVSVLGLSTRTVAQFDSWRFWESLAANCFTFHVDLEAGGCVLPVMPQNGREYFGVDLRTPRKEAERLRSLETSFGEIALSGRHWALTHYSPTATASRFVEYVR